MTVMEAGHDKAVAVTNKSLWIFCEDPFADRHEWLKKLNPDVKVIIVSGAEELRLRQILAQHQIDGYIRKPFRVQEALQIIRHVIAKPVGKPVAS